MNSSPGNLGRKLIFLTVIPWLLVSILGFSILMKYETTPGPRKDVITTWPSSTISYNKERPTLLMFVHSRCSCSKASLGELSKIVTNQKDKLDTRVYFYTPENADDDWTNSRNWQAAKSTPGVNVIEDPKGQTAAKFGAITSGHTFLYNTAGELVFNGGITLKRGTAGKNAGSDAIVRYISKESKEREIETSQTAVFGCEI